MNPQFVMATYQVAEKKQTAFIALLKATETIMRDENLISSKPIFRMRSNADPRIIIEVFEWQDETSFDQAQKTPAVLNLWGQYEAMWEKGGFGVDQIPEASQSWAQFSSIS